jgi:hypothetical protein
MAQKRKTPNIVSVQMPPQTKNAFDKVCADRGMTIKSALGRLICWFAKQDKTRQAIVLGQLDGSDVTSVAGLIAKRQTRPAAPKRARKTAR